MPVPGMWLSGMTDSSPQGRYNWQNTRFDYVHKADIIKVGRAFRDLHDFSAGAFSHPPSCAQCEGVAVTAA